MCGIAGILGPRTDEQILEKMSLAIRHRGPDGEGVMRIPQGVFAHRRLAIIDLSDAGRQPMVSHDGRFVITFNGELYNYLELREELSGYPFKTQTDTEVILAAWEHWGEAALDRFLGMFAFAISDTVEGTVTIVRDRLGIKPLFYCEHGTELYFASEIKGLLAAGVPHLPNESVIAQYLIHGYYDHTPETFFSTIKQLPAGHLLRWKNGQATIRRWWYLPDRVESIERLSDEECVSAFRSLFDDSLRIHLRSDVPVGITLSSGIDSLSLFYELRRMTELKNLTIFSMGYPDPAHDETAEVQRLAAREGVPFERVEIRPEDFSSLLPTTLKLMDQPFGGLSTMAYFKLMTAPKTQHVKVLLEGQGVDEMFGGYQYYSGNAYADLIRTGDWRGITHEIHRLAHDYRPWHLFAAARQFFSVLNPTHPTFQDGSRFIRSSSLKPSWVATADTRGRPTFEAPFASSLSNALYRDTMHTKLPRVLRFNDHVTMAHGIELRVPYLDHRIVEFAFSLSNRLKINEGMRKVILRETMKGVVPDDVRLRQKRPQSSPQTRWFKTVLKDQILSEIRSPRFRALPMVDAEQTERAFRKFVEDEADTNSFFFWQLIHLAHWYGRFA